MGLDVKDATELGEASTQAVLDLVFVDDVADAVRRLGEDERIGHVVLEVGLEDLGEDIGVEVLVVCDQAVSDKERTVGGCCQGRLNRRGRRRRCCGARARKGTWRRGHLGRRGGRRHLRSLRRRWSIRLWVGEVDAHAIRVEVADLDGFDVGGEDMLSEPGAGGWGPVLHDDQARRGGLQWRGGSGCACRSRWGRDPARSGAGSGSGSYLFAARPQTSTIIETVGHDEAAGRRRWRIRTTTGWTNCHICCGTNRTNGETCGLRAEALCERRRPVGRAHP